jgi:hypothetical protein
MKSIIAISLFFVTLLISGFSYAENYQSGAPYGKAGQSYGINHPNPPAVFAGPKVGWVKLPVEQTSSSLVENAR